MIWRDPAGRLSWLKLAVLAGLLWPGVDLLARYFSGALGGRPITQLIHGTGDWAIRFLLVCLAVSPLRGVWDWRRVVMLRRMLGVGSACYAGAHFTLYCIDQKWNLWTVASEIVLRFYLAIGFVALLGFLALAVTSTDGWQRRLRQGWKRLHRLVFVIAVLGLFHYFLQSKADVTNAVFATGVFAWLGFWRLAPKRWQGRVGLAAGLAAVAAVATAGVEGLWYGVATGVQASRVLWANFDVAAMRPSLEVLACGALVLAVMVGRRVSARWSAAGPAGRAVRRPGG